jgi:ferritin-like protein
MTQSVGFHENEDLLDPETRDRHRAIASLNEELEAVDWYDQRVKAAHDDELRAILAHNRDEEKEHAAMVLEWLRRRDPKLDEHLRNYLFQQKSPIDREHELEGESEGSGAGDGSLGIGSLREEAGR